MRSSIRAIALQWMRFVTVGVSNTLVSTTVFALLIRAGLHYLPASAIAFTLGAVNSYVLNRRWTFRSRGRRTPEMVRFVFVQAVGLGTDLALLSLAVGGMGLPRLPAQVLVFPLASAITFVLCRQWAFKAARVPAAGIS